MTTEIKIEVAVNYAGLFESTILLVRHRRTHENTALFNLALTKTAVTYYVWEENSSIHLLECCIGPFGVVY
jgi:hypothetical protein